jgi:protein tyrosine/serine phosphatase
MAKNYGRVAMAVLALIFNLAVLGCAQTAPNKEFPNIHIKNFGEMDKHYFRGAQPKRDDYQDLKNLGVTTVIDLRDDPTDYEKPAVEALGMRYFNIPMSDSSYPKPESIAEFLKLINDPANGKIFVHCKGGKHRTGVTGAVYRLTKDGWDFDKTYQEMKNYDFYSSWGHGKMKDFVVDYANKINAEHNHSSIAKP